jgi:hypothetical protein
VRRDLRSSSSPKADVRVACPSGAVVSYFMRRLGERPANVGFVIRAILSEKPFD